MSNKLIEFFNKYKRRFNRLITLIKSNNKLCFMYRVTSTIDYENDINIWLDYIISK
jgi:hypothetical protein